MSSTFVNSHQHVRLNRVGVYYKPVPEKGPCSAGVSPANDSERHAGETPALRNEKWRRWTGIVGADAERLNWKQRKRGIRRLLKQIEMRIVDGWPGPMGRAPKAQEAAAQSHSGLARPHLPTNAGRGASCRFATRPALRLGRATQSKRSRYFRTQLCEFFGLEPGEDERIRLSELLGKLDAL